MGAVVQFPVAARPVPVPEARGALADARSDLAYVRGYAQALIDGIKIVQGVTRATTLGPVFSACELIKSDLYALARPFLPELKVTEIDRASHRALVDAGYAPLSEYVQMPCDVGDAS
jgi:hypothetical protein